MHFLTLALPMMQADLIPCKWTPNLINLENQFRRATMGKRKKYDAQFRRQAVHLALTSDQQTIKIAEELGVEESTLYNWISKEKKVGTGQEGSEPPTLDALHEELMKLRRENQRLKEVNDILKKATTYFASVSN
jgi:transposase